MKKIFKTKFTFGKFLIGLLVIFGVVRQPDQQPEIPTQTDITSNQVVNPVQ